jgi:(R,R)-butanediol dehydrogenase/meso-butanediol dehydrogenase/diacetyl reductase
MKAAVFQGIGFPHLIENVADPIPGPADLVLEVERCGICGSDISLTSSTQGDYPMRPFVDSIYRPGAVLGHEFSGRIVAVGKDVRSFAIGDRIAPMFASGCGGCQECLVGSPLRCPGSRVGMGGFAQFATVRETGCVKMPAQLTVEEGALIEPMATSLHAVSLAKVNVSSRVLIFGTGALGLGIAYFARLQGAKSIVCVNRSGRQSDLVNALGADVLVKQSSTADEEIRDIMGGAPDVIFDAAGGLGLFNQAVELISPAGTIVLAGVTSQIDPVHHFSAMMKEVRVLYSFAYGMADFQSVTSIMAASETPIRHMIGETVALANFPAFFENMRSNNPSAKVIVKPNA